MIPFLYNQCHDFYRDERGKLYHWPGYLFIVGWILCLTTFLGSMALVALWVMNFSKMKTYQWVTGFVINFFFTILFVEPLKVVIFTVFVAARKKPIWDQDHVDADQKLPKIYYDMEDPENLKRPTRPKNIPPEYDPEYLEPLRFRRIQEGEMNAVIQDFLIYLVYLVIVLYVAEGPKDIDSFYMKENLEDSIVYGGLSCGRTEEDEKCKDEDLPTWHNWMTGEEEPNPWVDFMQVRDMNQWWMWVNTTLIPGVRVQPWYNGDPPYGLRGYLDDRVNRIIGAVYIIYEVINKFKPLISRIRCHKTN